MASTSAKIAMSVAGRALQHLHRAATKSFKRKGRDTYSRLALEAESLTMVETLRRAGVFLRPYKWRAAANIAFAILSLGFAVAFPQLTQYLIDDVLSTAPNQKSGYKFVFTPNGTVALTAGVPAACGASGDTGFSISATPITLGSTGTASYCVDETGVVRINGAGVVIPAPCSTSGFPPLQ